MGFLDNLLFEVFDRDALVDVHIFLFVVELVFVLVNVNLDLMGRLHLVLGHSDVIEQAIL